MSPGCVGITSRHARRARRLARAGRGDTVAADRGARPARRAGTQPATALAAENARGAVRPRRRSTSSPLRTRPVLAGCRPAHGAVDWRCRSRRRHAQSGGRHEAGEALAPAGGDAARLPPARAATSGATAIGRSSSRWRRPAATCRRDCAEGARRWGLTTQLYGLRSERNWGIGDFTDLARLAAAAGSHGAATLGTQPAACAVRRRAAACSPYSPSSRTRLDYLYIDVDRRARLCRGRSAARWRRTAALAAARDGAEVDHAAVAALKRPVLEALFRRLRDRRGGARSALGTRSATSSARARRQLAGFADLRGLARAFLSRRRPVLLARLARADARPAVPPRSPSSPATHAERVEFFEFLQWEADRQLGAAAQAGRDAGLSVGLYRDVAVGVNPHGAAAWADQELIVAGRRDRRAARPAQPRRAGLGAGAAQPAGAAAARLCPVHRHAARQHAPCRGAADRPCDVAAAALLDPARAWRATDGAYVDVSVRRAGAARRARKPPAPLRGHRRGSRHRARRVSARRCARRTSCRTGSCMFERRAGRAATSRPAEYPPLAAASAATHDLPSLKGFWLGRDIAWRRRLDALSRRGGGGDRQRRAPRATAGMLLEALAREGLIALETVRRIPAARRRAGLLRRARRCDPSRFSPARARG